MGLRFKLILVTTGIELRDVEDTVLFDGYGLERIVSPPDGSIERTLLNIDRLVNALLVVHKFNVRAVGNVERRRAISGLNLKFAGHALGIESDLGAGTDIDQTVDLRLFAKVDLCRGSSFVLFNFNGGSTLAGRDGAVIRELGAGLVLNEDTVAKVESLLHITHADEAVVDGFKIGRAHV